MGPSPRPDGHARPDPGLVDSTLPLPTHAAAAAQAAAAPTADPAPPDLPVLGEEDEAPPPPSPSSETPPPPRRRASPTSATLLSLGLTRPQAAQAGFLLRLDVRELREQAAKLGGRGIGEGQAAAAIVSAPALLTRTGAAAAAALLAQAGVRRPCTGAALAAFPGLLDAPGAGPTGLEAAFGGLLAEGMSGGGGSGGRATLALAARPLAMVAGALPSAAQAGSPAVDLRLHPAAAALLDAGARPSDVVAIARSAPALLATRAGRAALDWLWQRGVPAAEVGAAGAALGAALATHHARLLAELEAAGVRPADGLLLLLARPRLRRGGGGGAASRARAAVRSLARAGVPAPAIPALLLASPEVLERGGLGGGARALWSAGLTPAEVGAALVACPRLAAPAPGGGAGVRRALAELASLGLDPPAVRSVLAAHPAVAAASPSSLRATAVALLAAGVPPRAVPAVLAAAPALLTAGPAGVRDQVAFLSAVGVLSGAAAARWPALFDPALKPQVRYLRTAHGLAGARALGRALVAWPHLHGFGGGGGGGRGGGLRDLPSHLAALGASEPALAALLAPGGPPAVPPASCGAVFAPRAAATPAAAADAAAAAAGAAAGASPPAVALLAAGVPWHGLVAAASLAPALLSPSLAAPLADCLAGLRDGAGLDGEGLGRLLRWSAAALADAPPGGLRRALGVLEAAGVPRALAGRALLSAPGLLLLGGGGDGRPSTSSPPPTRPPPWPPWPRCAWTRPPWPPPSRGARPCSCTPRPPCAPGRPPWRAGACPRTPSAAPSRGAPSCSRWPWTAPATARWRPSWPRRPWAWTWRPPSPRTRPSSSTPCATGRGHGPPGSWPAGARPCLARAPPLSPARPPSTRPPRRCRPGWPWGTPTFASGWRGPPGPSSRRSGRRGKRRAEGECKGAWLAAPRRRLAALGLALGRPDAGVGRGRPRWGLPPTAPGEERGGGRERGGSKSRPQSVAC